MRSFFKFVWNTSFMIDDVLTAIPFGIILAFTIGPVFFVLLETSATKGFKSALIFDFGVILADVLFILVAFYSTNKLLDKVKDDPNFIIFGGVLLVAYGLMLVDVLLKKDVLSVIFQYKNDYIFSVMRLCQII